MQKTRIIRKGMLEKSSSEKSPGQWILTEFVHFRQFYDLEWV